MRRRRRRTRGGSNAVLRRTHRIRTREGRINNSIGVEERDKILEKSWSKVDKELQIQNCKFLSIKVMLGF